MSDVAGALVDHGRRGRRSASAGEAWLTIVGSVVAVAVLAGFFAVARWFGPDAWVPLLLAGVLVGLSIPVVRVLSGPRDRRLRTILVVGLVLKLACVLPRFAMNEVVYGGSADAGVYHAGGAALRANVLEEHRWSVDGAKLEAFGDESRFVGYVVGSLYLVTGASQLAGYLVFAWFSWLGLAMVFRAFQLAHPRSSGHLAAGLVFFLPSTLYWPSSIGKDALMVLAIGALTLGFTRLITGQPVVPGVALAAFGAGLVLQVRPHILLIVLTGVAVSMLARGLPDASSKGRVVGRLVLLVLLVPALFVGLSKVDQMFGSSRDGTNLDLSQALEQVAGRTQLGGSAIEAQPVRSPLDLPAATVNVVYRPFLFEASSVPAAVSALEGTALLVATVVAARWLWRLGPVAWRSPFAAFALGYVLAFVLAFSNIANAGILARQRVQLFPVLMVLVAAAAEHRRLNVAAPAADGKRADPALPTFADPRPRMLPVP